jgi:hypothetical protein
MALKRLIIICALASLLVGCAEVQPPAPLLGSELEKQKPSSSAAKKAGGHSSSAKGIVKTQPLKESSEIKPEPLPPSEQIPLKTQEPSLSGSAPAFAPSPVPPPATETPASSLPPSSSKLTPFEPIETSAQLSPAVDALVTSSNQDSQAGNLDLAAASIERAIRIEPRNPTLFYKLALLRLKESKPRMAEDLAKKSALLASTDNVLKKHCWLLIAHAREMQQNFAGAKEARAKADSF